MIDYQLDNKYKDLQRDLCFLWWKIKSMSFGTDFIQQFCIYSKTFRLNTLANDEVWVTAETFWGAFFSAIQEKSFTGLDTKISSWTCFVQKKKHFMLRDQLCKAFSCVRLLSNVC